MPYKKLIEKSPFTIIKLAKICGVTPIVMGNYAAGRTTPPDEVIKKLEWIQRKVDKMVS